MQPHKIIIYHQLPPATSHMLPSHSVHPSTHPQVGRQPTFFIVSASSSPIHVYPVDID